MFLHNSGYLIIVREYCKQNIFNLVVKNNLIFLELGRVF
jgi:hypothetical protein